MLESVDLQLVGEVDGDFHVLFDGLDCLRTFILVVDFLLLLLLEAAKEVQILLVLLDVLLGGLDILQEPVELFPDKLLRIIDGNQTTTTEFVRQFACQLTHFENFVGGCKLNLVLIILGLLLLLWVVVVIDFHGAILLIVFCLGGDLLANLLDEGFILHE